MNYDDYIAQTQIQQESYEKLKAQVQTQRARDLGNFYSAGVSYTNDDHIKMLNDEVRQLQRDVRVLQAKTNFLRITIFATTSIAVVLFFMIISRWYQ